MTASAQSFILLAMEIKLTDETIDKLRDAIWSELGGYEVREVMAQGATQAVLSRVVAVLDEAQNEKTP